MPAVYLEDLVHTEAISSVFVRKETTMLEN